MSKRKHKKRGADSPLRLHADASQAVLQLTNGTGWSNNEALTFIVRAGWNALNNGADKLPGFREVMKAAVAHHETELAMRKRLAATADKLRVARKAIGATDGGAE